jgi:hypothetical protein
MTTTEQNVRVRVLTPKGVLSYPHLLEPQVAPGADEAKFSTAFVFPEGTDLKEMKAAAFEVAKARFGGNVKSLIQKGKVRWPFRDDEDDVADKGYGQYGACTFVNASTKKKPGVVDAALNKVTDPEQIYAGRFARLTLTCYSYDVSGNKGVTFGLNNVQLLEHGDRIDGSVDAADDFDVVEEAIEDPTALMDTPDEDDLSDLMS